MMTKKPPKTKPIPVYQPKTQPLPVIEASHKAYITRHDGTRTSTWYSCTCDIGADHDAP